MTKTQKKRRPSRLFLLLFALLLFSLIGLLAAMMSGYALESPQLSARLLGMESLKKRPHPPTPSPTLTATPSPTASATPAPTPSPTFAPTPTPGATIPAAATPSINATVPLVKVGGGGPGSNSGVLPANSYASSHRVPQQGAHAVLPRILPIICITVGILLVIGGVMLLIGLIPAGKVKTLPHKIVT